MPVFSALGAECTVLDYSQKQIDSEIVVAKREGYTINTLRADMTKKLPFNNNTFDFLDNGINFLFDDTESKLTNSLPFNPLKNPQLKELLNKEDDGV